MKRVFQFGLVLVLAATAISRSFAGEVIDSIVALVNGEPVLMSEWQDRIRYDAMLERRSLDQITTQQEQDALQQAIDQKLVELQMRGRNIPPPQEEEIDARIAELRKQIPEANSDEGWSAVLQQFGLGLDQIRGVAETQVMMLRYVSAEILPGVHVENQSVVAYYRENLLPQARASGQNVPPLEDVSGDIREILIQQKAGELLDEWLKSLRSQSEIRMLNPRVLSSPEGRR